VRQHEGGDLREARAPPTPQQSTTADRQCAASSSEGRAIRRASTKIARLALEGEVKKFEIVTASVCTDHPIGPAADEKRAALIVAGRPTPTLGVASASEPREGRHSGR